MKKYDILKKVNEEKMVGIIRVDDAAKAEGCFDALMDGGVHCVEMTFTVPYTHTTIEKMTRKFGNDMIIGAGTVLDSETARIAILSGAKFLVTPTLNEGVIRLANRYGVPCFTGVATATEAIKALELGVDVVKIFPANQFSYSIIKDLKGPLPNLEVMPTGGVSVANIGEWIKAGAFACGVGGELTRGAKTGDYDDVRRAAKAFREAIKANL